MNEDSNGAYELALWLSDVSTLHRFQEQGGKPEFVLAQLAELSQRFAELYPQLGEHVEVELNLWLERKWSLADDESEVPLAAREVLMLAGALSGVPCIAARLLRQVTERLVEQLQLPGVPQALGQVLGRLRRCAAECGDRGLVGWTRGVIASLG